MSEIQELFRIRAAIAAEAVKNPDFLAALKSSPSEAISSFTGVDFSHVVINVVEEDGDTLTLPIPKISENLSAEQLEAVAGGAFFVATAATVSTVAGAVGGAAAVTGATYATGKSSGWW